MKNNLFLVLIILPAFLKISSAAKPNILIFLTDDMGIGDTRVYNQEVIGSSSTNQPPELPRLESLADAGMTFTQFTAPAALCAPNRYVVLSGNYTWRGKGEGGTWMFNQGNHFGPDQESIADMLKGQGYNTSMFGKVHLGALVPPLDLTAGYDRRNEGEFDWTQADFSKPLDNGIASMGFDYSFVTHSGIQGYPYMFHENDLIYGNPNDVTSLLSGSYPNDNGLSYIQEKQGNNFGLPNWRSNEVGMNLTQKALDFIDRHHQSNLENNTDTPFFMHYCAEAVHTPHTPPNNFLNGIPIAGETGGSRHMDMLYQNDISLGLLMDALEERNLLNNTLIIFTSDNGGLAFGGNSSNYTVDRTANAYNSNQGLRGNKSSSWEGGHRLPLIIRWGDGTAEGSHIPPNTRSDNFLALQDIYLTIADALNIQVNSDQALDAVSFWPILSGVDGSPVREYVYYNHYDGIRGIRSAEWKLLVNSTDPFPPLDNNYLLYNLLSDPAEEIDLNGQPQYSAIVTELHNQFAAIRGSSRSTPVYEPSGITPLKEDLKNTSLEFKNGYVSIYNKSGQKVWSGIVKNGKQSIEKIPLPLGIYVYKVEAEMGEFYSSGIFAKAK